MIIKELIEELKQFDENLVIVYQGDDYEEPSPSIRNNSYDTNYWNGEDFIKLPKGQDFIVLE